MRFGILFEWMCTGKKLLPCMRVDADVNRAVCDLRLQRSMVSVYAWKVPRCGFTRSPFSTMVLVCDVTLAMGFRSAKTVYC